MIVLDPVVRILLGVMNHVRKQLIDNAQQGCSQICGDLSGTPVVAQRGFEEVPRGGDIAPLRYLDVDHLAVLIHGAVDVAPGTVDLDVGLVDEPAVADAVPAGSGRVDE